MYRICALVLLFGAVASSAAPECARTDAVLEARDEIIEVVQSTAQSMVQMMIVIERIDNKVDKLARDLRNYPSHPAATTAPEKNGELVQFSFSLLSHHKDFLEKLLQTSHSTESATSCWNRPEIVRVTH